MPILTKPNKTHTLSHTDFTLHLLRIPVPNTDKSFVNLLTNYLLRMLMICQRRCYILLGSVFVQNCCGFGIEEEELLVFGWGYQKSLLTWDDHAINFGIVILKDKLDYHSRYFRLYISSWGYSITTSVFFSCFFIIERVMIGLPLRFYR